MKKKILSISLACMMLLPLFGYQAEASSSDAKTISVSSLPKRAQLESLLSWLEFYLSYTSSSYDNEYEYDYRDITKRSRNIFEALVRMPRSMDYSEQYEDWYSEDTVWDIYPGKRSQYVSAINCCYKSDKARIDWILLNVLNCSSSDGSILKSRCLNKQDLEYGNRITSYESNGYYYGAPYEIGWEQGWDRFDFLSAKYDGTYYYVRFHPYCDFIDYGLTFSDQYATLGLKNIDGKQYWSLYAISNQDFVSFSSASSSVYEFTDVPASAWYAGSVKYVSEKGLMVGVSSDRFDPQGNVTLAQAITMAARLHSQYNTGKDSFAQAGGSPWYQVYVDYAKKNRIIGSKYDGMNLNNVATRAQFAEIFAASLPDKALKKINNVPDRSIPDVNIQDSYAPSVYKLYRAGILVGSDALGTFKPQTSITRAESAAIVSRMSENDKRVKVTLNAPKAATGHRYEFVISDVSWMHAQRTAKSAGGYLVQIETEAEYRDLLAQLTAAGMQKVEFRIGAQRKSGTDDYYWVGPNGKLTGPILNSDSFWGSNEWLPGEPSLNWGGTTETVVEIYFSDTLGKWVWNDIWDTVTLPNVGTSYGYIIEYDR